jgi:hypothetical protein
MHFEDEEFDKQLGGWAVAIFAFSNANHCFKASRESHLTHLPW